MGVETIRAEGFTVLDRHALYVHPMPGSETLCLKIERRNRTPILSLADAVTLSRKEKAVLLERFDLTASSPRLSPQEILDTVVKQRRPYQLHNGLEIRVSTVMGHQCIEITGLREAQKEMLKALGGIVEIISWQARLFVPVNDSATVVSERLRNMA